MGTRTVMARVAPRVIRPMDEEDLGPRIGIQKAVQVKVIINRLSPLLGE